MSGAALRPYLIALWPVVVLAVVLALVLFWFGEAPGARQRIVTAALVNLVAVTGIYIFIGNSGVMSFGHVGFMAVGAYTSAWLTIPPSIKASLLPGLPAWLAAAELAPATAVPLAGLAAAAVAIVFGLPLMRLSGITASIGTFAMLSILHAIFANWTPVTGGQGSVYGMPRHTNMLVAAGWALLAMVAAALYQSSAAGNRLRASREDLVAARAVGVDVPRERLIAFVLSAFFVGVAGALFAYLSMVVVAGQFYLQLTFLTIAMLVIGGMRSLTGAFVGVAFVSVLAEVLRQAERGVDLGILSFTGRPGLQEVGLATAMLLALIFRPQGLTGGREIPLPRMPTPNRKSRKEHKL